MAVADFYAEFMQRLRRLGIDVHIWTMPSEIENTIPFEHDYTHAQYDAAYAQKFWLTLLQANRVMNEFRARFIGKVSPVHFFWGSFDLAVTRFSGRTAPPRERCHATRRKLGYGRGLFARGSRVAAFGLVTAATAARRSMSTLIRSRSATANARLSAAEAYYDKDLGQFILPYDTMRQARDPDILLLGFLQETYARASDLAKWDRKALERASHLVR